MGLKVKMVEKCPQLRKAKMHSGSCACFLCKGYGIDSLVDHPLFLAELKATIIGPRFTCSCR